MDSESYIALPDDELICNFGSLYPGNYYVFSTRGIRLQVTKVNLKVGTSAIDQSTSHFIWRDDEPPHNPMD